MREVSNSRGPGREANGALSSQRIMLVLQSADPPTTSGGMESLCIHLADEMRKRDLSVAMVLPETSVFDSLATKFVELGAEVERLDTDARRGRVRQLARLFRFVNLLRRWRPDVIHLHTGGATGGLAVMVAGRLATSASLVLTEHDVPPPRPKRADRFGRVLLDRVSHAIVSVSRFNAGLRSERLGGNRGDLAVVLNGIPADKAVTNRQVSRDRIRHTFGIEPSARLIGCVARLTSGKGLDVLLRGFSIVSRRRPCELLLVGDGPLRVELESLARTLGVSQLVHFAGYQADPMPYLDAMDIFALCVPVGSQSIALLEAMMRGIPAVITFWGPDEAVVPGQTGLVAPPNDPVAVAEALITLLEDDSLRTRMGEAAAEHVRRYYSIARVVDDLLDLYASAKRDGLPTRLISNGVYPGVAPDVTARP
jgi:glycosyltransferase involved in cell wall biosynthesis